MRSPADSHSDHRERGETGGSVQTPRLMPAPPKAWLVAPRGLGSHVDILSTNPLFLRSRSGRIWTELFAYF